jgi:hypothetical protein
MHFAQQLLNPANVSLVVIFIRDTPKCSFCDEAQAWIGENLIHAKHVTYSMSRNPVEWKEFAMRHPTAKSVPQIEVTMQNGSRIYIGGEGDLPRAFSSQTEESF